jgi:hypothetical protein
MAWVATEIVGLTYRESADEFKFRMYDGNAYIGVADTRQEALSIMRDAGLFFKKQNIIEVKTTPNT